MISPPQQKNEETKTQIEIWESEMSPSDAVKKKKSASACTTASLSSGEAASFYANTHLSVSVEMQTTESEAKG